MCIADGCDMQTTDDCRTRSHGVVRRKQIARVYFLETRETCSGMRGGAERLSVGPKTLLGFSRPEYDLSDTHSCEGARPATSGSSGGNHFCAPPMNGENCVHSCASFAWSKKRLLSPPEFSIQENEGHQYPIRCGDLSRWFPIAFSPPSSVAPCMVGGLCFGNVGQYETSSQVQEIFAAQPLVSIYPSTMCYFSGSFEPAS